jgi:hypothetical protein
MGLAAPRGGMPPARPQSEIQPEKGELDLWGELEYLWEFQ